MSQEERVDGFVPFAGEFVPRRCVPPVFVELTVGKSIEQSELRGLGCNLRTDVPREFCEPVAYALWTPD